MSLVGHMGNQQQSNNQQPNKNMKICQSAVSQENMIWGQNIKNTWLSVDWVNVTVGRVWLLGVI